MKMTRRQSLFAVAAAAGAAVLQARVLVRPRWLAGLMSKRLTPFGRAVAARDVRNVRPSRRVQPAPHSVKRHD